MRIMPNRVFLTFQENQEELERRNDEFVGCAWRKPDDSCDHVEYIRKDTIIDYLKRRQDVTLSVAADDLLQEVIDKIESL